MTSTSKIILGIVGAAAVGVAIGMLMAPEKGAEIRKKLSDTANDLAGKMGDMITAGKEKLTRRTDQVKESVG